jgi:predicted regulator of Ras-like GTPase activity (Roadblock/LC7/MglB family)
VNRDPYVIALNSAITEINKAYPDIKNSFIFTKNGNTLIGDQETDQKTINRIKESFQNLKEKTKTIGSLKNFTITTKNGKFILTTIKENHLLLVTTKNADKNQILSITQIIIPTIMKTIEDLTLTQTKTTPPKELMVDTITGFFAGDSVQIDTEVLLELIKSKKDNASLDLDNLLTKENKTTETIDQVEIETSNGNSTLCKFKEITTRNPKEKNMIKIPEKICKVLEINKGEMVKVKPVL